MEMPLCLTSWEILFEMMNSSKPEVSGHKIHMRIGCRKANSYSLPHTRKHTHMLLILCMQTDGSWSKLSSFYPCLAHCLRCGKKTQSLSSIPSLSSPHSRVHYDKLLAETSQSYPTRDCSYRPLSLKAGHWTALNSHPELEWETIKSDLYLRLNRHHTWQFCVRGKR